jgi:hypothetical protein
VGQVRAFAGVDVDGQRDGALRRDPLDVAPQRRLVDDPAIGHGQHRCRNETVKVQ